MSVENIGSGVALGFGATNSRYAVINNGDISDFYKERTLHRPGEFFQWMGRHIAEAAHAGHSWVVAGFPGPVSPDGQAIGPMTNVGGMNAGTFDVVEQLRQVDPIVGDLLDEGFPLYNVNDGAIAAQAVAHVFGEGKYGVVAAMINGTGFGLGIARRDARLPDIFRVDRQSLEAGHIPITVEPYRRIEELISGSAIRQRTGQDPRDLSDIRSPGFEIWREVGRLMGQTAMIAAMMNDVELVVPTGGVGIGGYYKYAHHMRNVIKAAKRQPHDLTRRKAPDVEFVDPSVLGLSDIDAFELLGAEGVVRDHLTRAAV